MDYVNYYVKSNNSHDEAIQGKCYSMCPESEGKLRRKERLVHVLERVENDYKMVKEFSRSAADANMAIPQLLRPYSVLKDTVHYLLLDVMKRPGVPTAVIYDFVNDRLRAVRQDMTIQRLPADQCTTLLEPMIRFYVYYGYKLCQYPITAYDPVLNKKYLLECLTLYLSYVDSMSSGEAQEISNSMAELDLKSSGSLKSDRILMESLYLLCNLEDVNPLLRYLQLPDKIKRHPVLQWSYRVATALRSGNFVRALRLAVSAPPAYPAGAAGDPAPAPSADTGDPAPAPPALARAAFALHLPRVHSRALSVLSVAYNKSGGVPAAAVARWLRLAARALSGRCRCVGLGISDGRVDFRKDCFKSDAVLVPELFEADPLNDIDVRAVFTSLTSC